MEKFSDCKSKNGNYIIELLKKRVDIEHHKLRLERKESRIKQIGEDITELYDLINRYKT